MTENEHRLTRDELCVCQTDVKNANENLISQWIESAAQSRLLIGPVASDVAVQLKAKPLINTTKPPLGQVIIKSPSITHHKIRSRFLQLTKSVAPASKNSPRET